MKICFLTTSYPQYKSDSRGIFIYKLSEALKNYSDINVTTINGYKYLTSGAGILPNLKMSFIAKLLFPFYITHFYFKIIKESRKCDIIHANWMLTGLLAILSKPFHNKKIILTERSPYLVSTNNKLFMMLNSFTFKNVDKLITISKFSKEKIQEKYKIKDVKVISNGIEKILISDKKKLREKLNIPSKVNVILYAGRLTKIKGIEYLLNAFYEIYKKNKFTLLIILGYGEYLETLKTNCMNLGLLNSVIFTGKKKHEEVIEFMQSSDLFVFPSLDETGGNVLLEAKSSGLPIITTKDIIKEGSNGFFIKKKNSKDIKDKIELLLKNKNLMKKMSYNNKKEKIKTWDECAKEYLRLYKKN